MVSPWVNLSYLCSESIQITYQRNNVVVAMLLGMKEHTAREEES